MEQFHDEWCAIVLVVDENRQKTVLVRETNIFNSSWKIPGGSKEPNETPKETAFRELKEETGLIATNMRWLATEKRREHDLLLFVADVESFSHRIPEGDEGEETGEFSLEVIKDPSFDFFFRQKPILTKAGLI